MQTHTDEQTHRTYIDTSGRTGDRISVPWCTCGDRGEPSPPAAARRWCIDHQEQHR